MAFAPKILGHKPRGLRGEMTVQKAREKRGVIRQIPDASKRPNASVGALPIAGTENPIRERPFFAFNPPRVKNDGSLQATTGPTVKAEVIPVSTRQFRKRVANARAGLNTHAADGAGLAFAKGRNQNPMAVYTPTPQRPVVEGNQNLDIPGQIRSPFTLGNRPVEIDSRIYQGQQTAGYLATRFF